MMIRILRCNEVHKADPLFVILPDFFSLLAATTKKIGRFFVQIMELIFFPTYSLGHPSVPSYPSCTVLGFANFPLTNTIITPQFISFYIYNHLRFRNKRFMLDNFLIEGKIIKIQHRYSIYTIIWSYSFKTGSTTLV